MLIVNERRSHDRMDHSIVGHAKVPMRALEALGAL
jgi:hypothetical protein